MPSKWGERLRHAFGFRLGLWYASLFVASSLALAGVTYFLVSASLRQYDREIIRSALVQYAAAYRAGGVRLLALEIEQRQMAATGPLLVRTATAGKVVTFLSTPENWRRFDLSQLDPPTGDEQTWSILPTGESGIALEVASVWLPDRTLFQVGMSTERRMQLLGRFRNVLIFNVVSIIAIGLIGGGLLTSLALQPVRRLTETVRSILRTGRTDARVTIDDTADTLGELSALVNSMLDRIDAVLAGMRGALDNVAHDLRTPMTRLRGIAETALASNDPAVLREALADCLEESDRLVAMLNTLMDISEAETGTMTLRVEPTDIADLIRQTIELYDHVADDRGVRITARTAGEVTAQVDRNRIRQVLANLVDNAVKYTDAGGQVELVAERQGDAIVVTIADTGAGIPDDELPLIWDRLYRGDKSRSTRGLGLGLSLVKAIVHAHGGRADVESTPGKGSRFTLRLPVAPNLSPL